MRAPRITNEAMDEKVAAFRNDPQKMDVTTKFVNEVIEKAKEEAIKRMKEKETEQMQSECESSGKRGRWHSRARGFFSRVFSSLCFCNAETKV